MKLELMKNASKRVIGLTLGITLGLGFSLASACGADQTKPNILLITVDDLGKQAATDSVSRVERLGSRQNPEVVRAKEIQADIDGAKTAEQTLAALRRGWENPPATYRPHIRWWWPGNAVTKERLDWYLEEMKRQGFGGTEPMSWLKVYEKGNIEFESPEFVELMRHVVEKSCELGMFVTPPFAPGWGHGSPALPSEHKAKAMVISATDSDGGLIDIKVPLPARGQFSNWEWSGYMSGQPKRFDALVAVALNDKGEPDTSRRIDLSTSVSGEHVFAIKPVLKLKTDLPPGRWRLLAFWTCLTGQKCTAANYDPPAYIVDHLSKEAVQAYLNHVGDRYVRAFGEHFGQPVDSFYGDSYELHHEFSYWSDGFFDRFKQIKGYDLRPYLPMLVYDGAPETPYIRYDFGHFLHLMGMEGITKTLTDYCDQLGIAMRQQPHYRFTTELIEASGVFQRPETENTKRSFEPMFWHKLTTSGAALYASNRRKWASAEAFTFINTQYKTSLEEIKRATDLFLRDGLTQFYNHSDYYWPTNDFCPSRDQLYMDLGHNNPWWPWHRGLADYQARAAFLSRQGHAETDVLVYSPMPTLWSERAEFPCTGILDLPFGPLPTIIVASGYDFDCVNGDLLLNHAHIKDGRIVINGFDYSVLILPRVIAISPETLGKVAAFVKSGGTVLALSKLPEISTGLKNRQANDVTLAGLRDELFDTKGGAKVSGKGKTWFFPDFEGLKYLTAWDPSSKEWEPTAPLSQTQGKFIQALRSQLTPDFEIAGKPQSDGLTFRHARIGELDCWFLTNLQPTPCQTEVTLKTDGGIPQFWDAMTGGIAKPASWRYTTDGRLILPVKMDPWDSIFVLIKPGRANAPPPSAVLPAAAKQIIRLEGTWQVSYSGIGDVKGIEQMESLVDWAKLDRWKNFSGQATYTLEFEMPDTLAAASSAWLDLGVVHEVAAIRANGKEAGKVWMQPYRLNLAGLLKPGRNKLEVTVANLLWNYCVGLKKPRPMPDELHAHYGVTWRGGYRGWDSFQSKKKIAGGVPLSSGLLGPVTLEIIAHNANQQ